MDASIEEALDSREQPLESEVETLIRSMKSPATFRQPERDRDPFNAPEGALTFPQPIQGLVKLGRAALRAIIKHLKDRDRLPGAPVHVELDIRSHPGAFEGTYHTEPSR
jgi:hypothetical protein